MGALPPAWPEPSASADACTYAESRPDPAPAAVAGWPPCHPATTSTGATPPLPPHPPASAAAGDDPTRSGFDLAIQVLVDARAALWR